MTRPSESIIRDVCDWYDSTERKEYGVCWNDASETIMMHAYVLFINVAWANRQFEENNQVGVLQQIIDKCRRYLRHRDSLSRDDEFTIERILDMSRRELYRRLMLTIDEYCLV